VSEPNWLRRFIVANLNLWDRGDKRGAAVADIATATGRAPGDITAELKLMQAEGLARRGDDERWHPEAPGEH
jgi:DNA-binding IclR family transcriptional regulator